MKLPRGFEVARAASLLSNARRSRKVGAALYAGGTLLSVGYNSYGTTHTYAANLCNMHAEHRCLVRRRHYEGRNRSKWVIFVYRELADGSLACSRPCKNCRRLMEEAGVNQVNFINEKREIDRIRIT